MVNKESKHSFYLLMCLLVVVLITVIALVLGMAFSNEGEIQAPGTDRNDADKNSIVEIV